MRNLHLEAVAAVFLLLLVLVSTLLGIGHDPARFILLVGAIAFVLSDRMLR